MSDPAEAPKMEQEVEALSGEMSKAQLKKAKAKAEKEAFKAVSGSSPPALHRDLHTLLVESFSPHAHLPLVCSSWKQVPHRYHSSSYATNARTHLQLRPNAGVHANSRPKVRSGSAGRPASAPHQFSRTRPSSRSPIEHRAH
jgi:hypothetical protein